MPETHTAATATPGSPWGPDAPGGVWAVRGSLWITGRAPTGGGDVVRHLPRESHRRRRLPPGPEGGVPVWVRKRVGEAVAGGEVLMGAPRRPLRCPNIFISSIWTSAGVEWTGCDCVVLTLAVIVLWWRWWWCPAVGGGACAWIQVFTRIYTPNSTCFDRWSFWIYPELLERWRAATLHLGFFSCFSRCNELLLCNWGNNLWAARNAKAGQRRVEVKVADLLTNWCRSFTLNITSVCLHITGRDVHSRHRQWHSITMNTLAASHRHQDKLNIT